MNHADDARLTQLLIDRATVGLDPEERGELDTLLAGAPGRDGAGFEAAAAAVALGCMPVIEPLPDRLRACLTADARPYVDVVAPAHLPLTAAEPGPAGPALGGWLMAAAAAVVAIIGWWPAIEVGDAAGRPVGAEVYHQFVDRTPDVVKVPWTGREPGYSQVTGDVVWSAAEQTGFMRLVGLPANDPRIAQYQLWIVDPARDTHPIDGGVFDVAGGGEVFIPIDAKLNAPSAAAFAITLEQPGGVVVSDGPLLVVGSRS